MWRDRTRTNKFGQLESLELFSVSVAGTYCKSHPSDKTNKIDRCEPALSSGPKLETHKRRTGGIINDMSFPEEEGHHEEEANDQKRKYICQ